VSATDDVIPPALVIFELVNVIDEVALAKNQALTGGW